MEIKGFVKAHLPSYRATFDAGSTLLIAQLQRIDRSLQQINRQLPPPTQANVDVAGAMHLVAPAKQQLPLNDNERITEGYLQRRTAGDSWVTLRYVGERNET